MMQLKFRYYCILNLIFEKMKFKRYIYWPTVLASGQYEEMKQFHWSRALDNGRKPEPYCPRVLTDVKMVAFVTNSYAKTDSFIVSFF